MTMTESQIKKQIWHLIAGGVWVLWEEGHQVAVPQTEVFQAMIMILSKDSNRVEVSQKKRSLRKASQASVHLLQALETTAYKVSFFSDCTIELSLDLAQIYT